MFLRWLWGFLFCSLIQWFIYNNCFKIIHQNASVPNDFDILSDDSACHWRHVNMLFFATAKWWNFKRLGRSGRHWKTSGQQNQVLRGSFSLAPVGFHKLGDSLSPPYFIHSAMLINLELWTPPPPPYKSSALTHLSLLFRAPCALKIWPWSFALARGFSVQQCSIQSFS